MVPSKFAGTNARCGNTGVFTPLKTYYMLKAVREAVLASGNSARGSNPRYPFGQFAAAQAGRMRLAGVRGNSIGGFYGSFLRNGNQE